MGEKNLLEDNVFILKVTNKDKQKDIQLRKYSFSIQIKLMKSGLINKLTDIQKQLNTGKDFDPSSVNWVIFGELLETAAKVIYEMFPDDLKITKTPEDIMDTMVDGEAMRFINWIFEQFSKNNAFLAQENLKEEATPQE